MEGHFDYGNGYHGRLYLNPHQLFRYPVDDLARGAGSHRRAAAGIADAVTVVAGPVTGGALLAHTIAGLLDGRRPLTREPYSFAPLHQPDPDGAEALSPFYAQRRAGRQGAAGRRRAQHRARPSSTAPTSSPRPGARWSRTAQIVDRGEAVVTLPVPNVALVEYPAPENYAAAACPLCAQGMPVAAF